MVILGICVVLMVFAGAAAAAAARRWPSLTAPRVAPARALADGGSHTGLEKVAEAPAAPAVTTGFALTAAVTVTLVGAVGIGVLLLMVRGKVGFAHFDLGAAQFAARHASSGSTAALRALSQIGGALVLVPATVVVAAAAAFRWRRRVGAVVGFLAVTVGGQYALADLIKLAVNRTRPNVDRLTGFSGASFPSGHATAAAATFAAFALLAGLAATPRTRALLTGVAVALAVGVAATRVFLGVHWLTDVLAGLILGWAWFALSSIAFGGRLLRFGAPVEQAQRAVGVDEGRPVASPAAHARTG